MSPQQFGLGAEVEDLIREILLEEPDRASGATTEAAFLLELNSFPVAGTEYEQRVRPSLLIGPLSERDEGELADALVSVARRGFASDSSGKAQIWAIGKGRPWVILPRLMSLIDEVPSMDEDSLFQYLYSLRGSLEIPEDHSRFEDLIQQLGASRSLITTMATNVYRDERHDREIQLTALDVVENVEIALAPPHLRGAAVYTRFLVRDDILGDFWQRVRDRVIEAGWDLRGTLVVGCQEDDSETQRYILREPGGGLFVIGDSDSSGDPIGVELDPASPADIESVRDVLNDISRLQAAIPRS